MAGRDDDPSDIQGDLFGAPIPRRPPSLDVRAGTATGTEPGPDGDDGRDADLFGRGDPGPARGGTGAAVAARTGMGATSRGPGPGVARASSGAGAPPAAGPATDRQIGFALDISRALRLPMPGSRDVETIGAFIAANRAGLKDARTRP